MITGIDHLVVAVRSVDEAAAVVERDLGLAVTGGGRHVGMGTVNRLAFLGDAYLELIGVEDVALVRSSPTFAVGAAALAHLETRGEGLATYALATDDLAGDRAVLVAAGSRLGEIVPGRRLRDDGVEVRWWCAFPAPLGPGRPPFLIEHAADAAEWGPDARARRAAFRHPVGGAVRLASLAVPVGDPAAAGREYAEVLGIAFSEGWRAVLGAGHEVRLREGGGAPVVELRAEPGTPSVDLVRFGVRWRR